MSRILGMVLTVVMRFFFFFLLHVRDATEFFFFFSERGALKKNQGYPSLTPPREKRHLPGLLALHMGLSFHYFTWKCISSYIPRVYLS